MKVQYRFRYGISAGNTQYQKQCCGAIWLFWKTAPAPTFSKNGSDSGSLTLEQSKSKYTSLLNIEHALNIFQGQKYRYKVKSSDVGYGST